MKFENLFPFSTYCINIKSRTDRWDSATIEFEKINIKPERFDAIENKKNPAAGCRESHLAILKEAKKKNENVFIFEDDVEFIDNANIILDNAISELSELDWAMFYIGGNILKPFYQVSEHLAKLSHCQSAHAYGINKKYISDIIDIIEINNTFIDVIYADGIIPYINAYITIPMIAIQKSGYSNIENKIMTYEIPIARYNHFLVRKNEK